MKKVWVLRAHDTLGKWDSEALRYTAPTYKYVTEVKLHPTQGVVFVCVNGKTGHDKAMEFPSRDAAVTALKVARKGGISVLKLVRREKA